MFVSDLIDFYLNQPNPSGFRLNDILNSWSIEDWDHEHGFIQWLFPLKEPSNFNPDAPILTDEDIKLFRDSFRRTLPPSIHDVYLDPDYWVLYRHVFMAFMRFTAFLGLNIQAEPAFADCHSFIPAAWGGITSTVMRSPWPHDEGRVKKFICQPNHNWLRITRCLTSLRLLGLEFAAKIFFDLLGDLWNKNDTITVEVFQYWQDAMQMEIK